MKRQEIEGENRKM